MKYRRRSDGWVPLLIVIVVIGLLHDRSVNGRLAGNSGVAVFSSTSSVVDSKDFRSADAVAVFGRNRLDLRGASFAESRPRVSAVAVFGQVEIIVPPGTRITGESVPFLGRVEYRVRGGQGPSIEVDGVALFGSVVVRE
ncbi:MAG: hypothetical protein ABI693_26180 [Bryobacteraceae bacterium]